MEFVLFENNELTITGVMLLAGLIIWSVVWTGLALWRAARLGQKGWFIALLLINSMGVLEILYLLVISKKVDVAPTKTETP